MYSSTNNPRFLIPWLNFGFLRTNTKLSYVGKKHGSIVLLQRIAILEDLAHVRKCTWNGTCTQEILNNGLCGKKFWHCQKTQTATLLLWLMDTLGGNCSTMNCTLTNGFKLNCMFTKLRNTYQVRRYIKQSLIYFT